MSTPSAEQARELACSGCGAGLKFAPGTESLTCPYCGAHTPVPAVLGGTEELDYGDWTARLAAESETHEVLAARCTGCGAETTLGANVVSDECPFCSASLIRASESRRLVKPTALLPFRVTRPEAERALQKWMSRVWFAPDDFLASARREGKLAGVYVPCWTFDCRATTSYTGSRGEWYWEDETYTTTEDGKRVERTRSVRRTEWHPADGVVRDSFDDVLVPASDSLPAKEAAALEPWDLESLVAYSEEYLSGFRTESYKVTLVQGFARAQTVMDETIRRTVERDIGGDEQEIRSKHTTWEDVTFKHLLLPVWISSYLYRDKVYRILVNARTGEVQGERPWSWIKLALFWIVVITLAVLLFRWLGGGESSGSYGALGDGRPQVEMAAAA